MGIASRSGQRATRRPVVRSDLVPGWLSLTVGRWLLACAGVALLVEGAIVAWGADAATSLIIAGSVLLVLGLFPWRQLKVEHPGSGTVATLMLAEADERLDVALEHPDLPPAVRENLEAAKAELEEAAAVQTSTIARVPITYTASHRRREDAVDLYLHSTATHILHRVHCLIVDPNGQLHKALAQTRSMWSRVTVVYPTDFEDAPAGLMPGSYRVTWMTRNMMRVAFTDPKHEVVATDRFTID